MKKTIRIISQTATGIAASLTLMAGKAMAFSVQEGADSAKADAMPADLVGMNGVFTKISNTMLLIIGIVSVIMLIIGGLRYIVSGGDTKKVTDAKNTILYAIIGLIISLLAYAIINFVITAVTGQSMEIGQ